MSVPPDTITYRAAATSVGGRQGRTGTADGSLTIGLDDPVELGGAGQGSTPEELFAMGYSACFNGALRLLAPRAGVDVSQAEVTAVVGFGPEGASSALTVDLGVLIPGVSQERAQELAEAAHAICPFSKAIHGNVPVTVSAVDGQGE